MPFLGARASLPAMCAFEKYQAGARHFAGKDVHVRMPKGRRKKCTVAARGKQSIAFSDTFIENQLFSHIRYTSAPLSSHSQGTLVCI
jgi:hypothetical protein